MIGTVLNDYLVGSDASDTIDGAAGNDTIQGLDGVSYLRGGDGDDSITGGADFDDINGNKGDDTIDGGPAGADWLVGGQGDDLIIAHAGDSILYGNLGNDTLAGGAGAEILRGGQGDDSVIGGLGDDWISGDRGRDTLIGGSGADTFHSFAGAGLDLVMDFNVSAGDRVQLDAGTNYVVRERLGDTVVQIGSEDRMLLHGVQLNTLAPNRIEIVAHRGIVGGYGEETIESYEAAYKMGLRTMELDLQVTKDGQVVLMHDPTVDRTTNGTGAVTDLTLAQIQSFGVRGVPGARVPTWQEFLDWAKTHPDVYFWAETKGYRAIGDIQLMLTGLVNAGMQDRATWDSFNFRDLQWLRAHGSTSEMSPVLSAIPADVSQELSRDAGLGGAVTLMVESSVLLARPDFVSNARAAGLDIAAWTVDDKPTVDRLLAMDVHIITSNKLAYIVDDRGWVIH